MALKVKNLSSYIDEKNCKILQQIIVKTGHNIEDTET